MSLFPSMAPLRERNRRRLMAPYQTPLFRGVILGLVVALHLVAVMHLPPSSHQSIDGDTALALRVRFIVQSPARAVLQSKRDVPPIELPAEKASAKRRANVAITSLPTSSKVEISVPINRPAEMTLTQHQELTYLEGGRLLRGDSQIGRTQIRLPGSAGVQGSTRFPMVDPKMQGMGAFVVHAIGGLTGAVDGHCVDLDAWRGMTVDERIKNHVSESDMVRVQQNFNCDAARRPKR